MLSLSRRDATRRYYYIPRMVFEFVFEATRDGSSFSSAVSVSLSFDKLELLKSA